VSWGLLGQNTLIKNEKVNNGPYVQYHTRIAERERKSTTKAKRG